MIHGKRILIYIRASSSIDEKNEKKKDYDSKSNEARRVIELLLVMVKFSVLEWNICFFVFEF